MTVMGNFYFSIFLQLTWEFLDLESERGVSVCWPNNKIIDLFSHKQKNKNLRNRPQRVENYSNSHDGLFESHE